MKLMKLKTWSLSILPTLLMLGIPALSIPTLGMAQVSVGVSINIAPPELPVYVQPPIPQDGFMWTPGYWAWDPDVNDYYWVPGTWVPAPQVGFLWTPGYWGFVNGAYMWNGGYWGPHIGFYGGVNYGFGYGGSGFEGGYWQGGHLFYNRSVTNITNVQVTNVYNKTVVNNVTVNRVSFNGGSGGIQARATPAEISAAHEQHVEATPAQRQQVETARSNPALRLSANKGHPAIAATARAGAFSGAGVVAAKEAKTAAPAHQPAPREAPQNHAPAPAAHAPAPAPREAEPRDAQPKEPAPRAEAPHPAAAPPRPAPEERKPEPKAEPRPEERQPDRQ